MAYNHVEILVQPETMLLQPAIRRKLELKLKLFKQLKHKPNSSHLAMLRPKHALIQLHMPKLWLSHLNTEMLSVIIKLRLGNNPML